VNYFDVDPTDGDANVNVPKSVFQQEGFWPGYPHNDIVALNYVRGIVSAPPKHANNLVDEVSTTPEWRTVPCD
jgi:hypothetical protein